MIFGLENIKMWNHVFLSKNISDEKYSEFTSFDVRIGFLVKIQSIRISFRLLTPTFHQVSTHLKIFGVNFFGKSAWRKRGKVV